MLSLVNQITVAQQILLPLEDTVQFGGSQTNLHFKTYFRNRTWKPEFTDSYFPLSQWCLNTPYRLVAWAAVQLTHPLIQPHVSGKDKIFALFTLLWKLAIPILSRWWNELSAQLLKGKNLPCFRPRRANAIITSLRLCLAGRFAACEHCYLQMAALLYILQHFIWCSCGGWIKEWNHSYIYPEFKADHSSTCLLMFLHISWQKYTDLMAVIYSIWLLTHTNRNKNYLHSVFYQEKFHSVINFPVPL